MRTYACADTWVCVCVKLRSYTRHRCCLDRFHESEHWGFAIWASKCVLLCCLDVLNVNRRSNVCWKPCWIKDLTQKPVSLLHVLIIPALSTIRLCDAWPRFNITLAFSVFTTVTSLLAGACWSVCCSSWISEFFISIFAMIVLVCSQNLCIVFWRGFLAVAVDRNQHILWSQEFEVHHFKCPNKTSKTFLEVSLFPPYPLKTADQNTNTRTGLMSFDSFSYMIPSSFLASGRYWVYTGWTFISWLWVCMSNNQLWRFNE